MVIGLKFTAHDSLSVFGGTCNTAGQPWAELCPPDMKFHVLNCMASLCFLMSPFYKVLCPHIWKQSFVNTWKHLRTLKSYFCLDGINIAPWTCHAFLYHTVLMMLMESEMNSSISGLNSYCYWFNICNHQIKIWTWWIANMTWAWIVKMTFPHTA